MFLSRMELRIVNMCLFRSQTTIRNTRETGTRMIRMGGMNTISPGWTTIHRRFIPSPSPSLRPTHATDPSSMSTMDNSLITTETRIIARIVRSNRKRIAEVLYSPRELLRHALDFWPA